jgi:hypothetical protein
MQFYTMSSDKKFNIRIKFNPKDLKTDLNEQPTEPNYTYHWPRIISAAILTFSLIGISFYYVNNDASDSVQIEAQSTLTELPLTKESSTASKKNSETSTISVKNTDEFIDKIEQAPQENNAEITTTNISDNQSNEDLQIKEVAEKEIVTTNISNNEPISVPVITPPTAIKTALETEVPNLSSSETKQQIEDDNKNSALATQQQKITLSPIFKQTKIEIYSPQINRFVIAKDVNNKEPIGTIEDIQFDENNIATVYAYSDAIGFADKFLYYEWRLNGKQIAMIEIGAWGDRWRSYTHKFIQPNKRGNWSVILKNGAGEKLAIAEFTY